MPAPTMATARPPDQDWSQSFVDVGPIDYFCQTRLPNLDCPGRQTRLPEPAVRRAL